MPLRHAIPRHPRSGRWLEWMRNLGRRAARYHEEAQDSGGLSRRRADDDQESWIGGYSAFWQDLVAAWLVAVLIAVIVLAVQSSKDPLRNIDPAAARTSAGQTPPGKATSTPVRGESGNRECTDIDYAYGRC